MPAKKTAKKAAKKFAKEAAQPAAEAPAAKATEVKLGAAKGRPMLQWVGKKPLNRVTAFPAQLVESFDPAGELTNPKNQAQCGNLYYGDNKEVLAHLLANGYRGKVDIAYIDPPFDSAADYVRKVTLRGKSALAKIEGESLSLGEQVQYTDIWANDSYLQFMYERLILLKELLSEDGFLFLHLNLDRSHYCKCLCDEIFSPDSFHNQIIWKRTAAHADTQGVGNVHDVLLVYSKSATARLQKTHIPYSEAYIASHYNQSDEDGRKFQLVDLTAPGPRKGLMYEFKGVWPPTGRVWSTLPEKMEALDKAGRIVITGEGRPRKKQYLDEMSGMPVHDLWDDVAPVNSQALEATGYPTQKSEALIRRIVELASPKSGLVLDCFLGSGTTAAVAQKLGRRWIGCDINKGAVQTASKRLQGIILGQEAELAAKAEKAQDDMFGGEGAVDDSVTPAALSFRVHRVNDYDLNIQHNEAVALACEHIGVTRTKTDAYFDGTQGKRLVKIIPFNHPLSPTDLEQLKGELSARANEERDILLVCLGKELACEAWLTDWSRLRKRGDVPNKIEVIELRTDPKYGKFMTHTSASAKISVKRKAGELHITIEDFTSPTIIERLDSQDSRLFKAQVTDWRFMVDCVMIDPAHDGKVFQIALTDLPEKKADLVSGTYTLPAQEGKTTVAVKIIDMLGEEVFHTHEV